MEQVFDDKTFSREDFKDKKFVRGEYDHCVFRNCDLGGADLSASVFIECIFADCNLSLVKLNNTVFRDVQFKDCKMMGIHFENGNKFGLIFTIEKCSLSHSSFYRTSLKKNIFRHAQLTEVDFTECDLTGAVFENCNLLGAKFENTILEKADLRTSFSYSINPEINRIKKAKFSVTGIAGLLDKYDIDIE